MNSMVFRIAAALLLAWCTNFAAAADYPTKPVRLVVVYPPGGGIDLLARVMGQQFTASWGQTIVVDNRPGAGTTIGAAVVAKRPLTVEQVPRALARGCDPVVGCKRRTQNRGRMRAYAVASP